MSRCPSMSLRDLLAGHADAGAAGDIRVNGLSLDSRSLRAGEAFVALAGSRMHGMGFAPTAVSRGAVAILADPAGIADATARDTAAGTCGAAPLLWVEDLRARVGALAARLFGEPSRALHVTGVTGTNGKTSTVQLIAQALQHAGRITATIGTLGAGLHGRLQAGERTTPDAIQVQDLLAQFRDAGASHVAMEVSSHALDQGRVNAVDFDLAVFTNLTRDHLDYHGTMQAYGAAKARLFAWPGLRAAIINVDDAFGRELVAQLETKAEGLRLHRCGIDNDAADIVARKIETGAHGLDFHLGTPWGAGPVSTALLGRFNVSNLLAVVAVLGECGLDFAAISAALAALDPVPGRMSRLGGAPAQPLVVVDYAHTPDALEQALRSLRAHCRGELICVFGCGGERDAGKRPQMAAIAEALADRVIVTDDNPRAEDGDAIVGQIRVGFRQPKRVHFERDRARAIAAAVKAAAAADVVLVAGKGHEPYQEIAGTRRPFDDLAVARAALEARPC